MARRKTVGETTTATDRTSQAPALSASVTAADVARRAYDLYLARGRADGYDVDDWLQAERELRATANVRASVAG